MSDKKKNPTQLPGSNEKTWLPPDIKYEDHEDAVLDALTEHGPHLLFDPYWRLNNLYFIQGEDIVEETDRAGNVVEVIVPKQMLFRMRDVQDHFWIQMWFLNIVLKSRQHGFTTLICLIFLDSAFFGKDLNCGIIADTLGNAEEIFRTKIEYPYTHLPKFLRDRNETKEYTKKSFVFDNESRITTGTSLRSGTYDYLLISEYAKVCVDNPKKAEEIRTGALNTIHAGAKAFIESTGRGQAGDFVDRCKRAQNLVFSNTALSKLDWKFNFYPWWMEPKNVLPPQGIVINDRLRKYFDQAEKEIYKEMGLKVQFTREQKAWYVKKEMDQGEFMYREHPSTPKEAFRQSLEGTYFPTEMRKMREEGRICSVPYQDNIAVDTWWDIGWRDPTAIIFSQTVGTRIHIIDYYENSGEGVKHYIEECKQRSEDFGWTFRSQNGPHDVDNHEYGTGMTIKATAGQLNFHFNIVPKIDKEQDGIQAVRNILPQVWIDEEHCEQLIKCLDSYRKEWNDKLGTWRDHPLHDWASHGEKATETLALGHGRLARGKSVGKSSQPRGAVPVRTRRFAT